MNRHARPIRAPGTIPTRTQLRRVFGCTLSSVAASKRDRKCALTLVRQNGPPHESEAELRGAGLATNYWSRAVNHVRGRCRHAWRTERSKYPDRISLYHDPVPADQNVGGQTSLISVGNHRALSGAVGSVATADGRSREQCQQRVSSRAFTRFDGIAPKYWRLKTGS